MQLPAAGRSDSWKWYVCVLLLFATVVNYMDRLTTNNLALAIQHDFDINNEYYGHLELGFGMAFAFGSLLWGYLVDRVGVYWLYPLVLIGWSAMGFLTGLSETYSELLLLRILLGLFEAGHFPCGLKTVQLLLEPRDRALGNSLLQSGTAVGAILAPIAIRLLATPERGGWRLPFLVIGAGGCIWVLFWLLSVRPRDLRRAGLQAAQADTAGGGGATGRSSFLEVIFTRGFLALAIMVVCINLNWHLFRVWLPKFLQETRGYSQNDMLTFSMLYYLAADIGVMSAGAASQWMSRRGASVFASRMWAYFACAVLTTATTVAAFLPAGPLLLGALLTVAFGGLGCFAAYYSFTQDLSRRHQGKVSGSLATCTWLVTAAFHPIFGRYLDRTHNYDLVVGAMGWLPMVALVAMLLLWRARPAEVTEPPASTNLAAEPAEALGA